MEALSLGVEAAFVDGASLLVWILLAFEVTSDFPGYAALGVSF
jgi:hypothetical protein